jgi:hypothetical protein
MNTHTKVTMLGMFAGAAIVALASSGACNHSVQVDCATVGALPQKQAHQKGKEGV